MSNGFVSDRHPAHAEILARPAPRLPELWLIARTPTFQPYPCACRLGRNCNTYGPHPSFICNCWGRTDIEHVPTHCCARRWQS